MNWYNKFLKLSEHYDSDYFKFLKKETIELPILVLKDASDIRNHILESIDYTREHKIARTYNKEHRYWITIDNELIVVDYPKYNFKDYLDFIINKYSIIWSGNTKNKLREILNNGFYMVYINNDKMIIKPNMLLSVENVPILKKLVKEHNIRDLIVNNKLIRLNKDAQNI